MRTGAGLSQPQLAERAGISDPTAVSRWENGHHAPSSRYMYQLAKVFGVSLDVLRGADEVPPDWEMPSQGKGKAVETGAGERGTDFDVAGMTNVWFEHLESTFAQVNSVIEEAKGSANRLYETATRMQRGVGRLHDEVNLLREAITGEFKHAPESKETKKLASMLAEIRKRDMERVVRVTREWERHRRQEDDEDVTEANG